MKLEIKTIAHRYGNDLADLEKALEANGVDAIECDVWWSGGTRFSVHHNKKYWIFPLIGFERWKGKIRFVFSWKDLWLQEVFAKTAGKKILVLNIKGGYSETKIERMLGELFALLMRSNLLDSVVLDPQSTHAYLTPLQKISHLLRVSPPPVRFSIGNQTELRRFLSLNKERKSCLSGIVVKKSFLLSPGAPELQKQSLPICAYTVNDYDEAVFLRQKGAASIVSDKLEVLYKLNETN